jgi:DNA-binding MarR family transcriptional regulator
MPRREASSGRGQFEVANRLFFRLYQCSNLLHKNGTRHVADFGATTQQWAVLGALSRPTVRKTGMTVKGLVEYLLLSRQNLTAVLDRLEARQWIERVRDVEDGRNRLIRMTVEGSRNWNAMQGPIEAFYASALVRFSEKEQALLCELLDRLKNGLNEV